MGVFDEPFSFLLLATVRWASYLAALALVGASTFRYLGRDSDGGSAPARAAVDSRLAAIGVGAASGLLLLASLKLYGQTYAIFGLDEPVTVELMRVMALDTRWGAGWLSQVAVAVWALAAFEAARRSLPGSWTAATAASGVAAASLPLTGHAVAEHG